MIHHFRYSPLLRTGFAMAALLWLSACGNVPDRSYAAHYNHNVCEDADGDDYCADTAAKPQSFDEASLSDSDLGDMRGGFLFAGGLRLDFGLSSTTSINGVVMSNFSFNTSKFNGTLPSNLRQIIQVGTGNNFTSPTPSPATTTVLTLVQNTINNATIQNQNILTLNVSNFASFSNRLAEFNSLMPFIRALH